MPGERTADLIGVGRFIPLFDTPGGEALKAGLRVIQPQRTPWASAPSNDACGYALKTVAPTSHVLRPTATAGMDKWMDKSDGTQGQWPQFMAL